MKFEAMVTHEAACSRLVVEGEAGLGRMLSLLQVLGLDSAAWPRDRLLVDLRRHDTPLQAQEQQQLAEGAVAAFPRMARIAFLTPQGRMREGAGARVFSDEGEALVWLAGA